jgi:hypothetical protein
VKKIVSISTGIFKFDCDIEVIGPLSTYLSNAATGLCSSRKAKTNLNVPWPIAYESQLFLAEADLEVQVSLHPGGPHGLQSRWNGALGSIC